MQLTTALEGFWLTKARSLSQNTMNDYSHSFGRFKRFIAAQHIEDIESITPQHVNAFLTWLDTDCGLAPKTILNHWIALSALWTWAEKELGLSHIIRGRVAAPRVRRQQPLRLAGVAWTQRYGDGETLPQDRGPGPARRGGQR